MKIVIVSDTHGHHDQLTIPEADVLVHCGDMFDGIERHTVHPEQLDAWFASLPVECVVCTGGNHDDHLQMAHEAGHQPFEYARVLIDEAWTHQGVTFYGAPWVPRLQGWSFYESEQALPGAWARIPDGVDVLVTHTPPKGILDVSSRHDLPLGCPHLLERVEALGPKIHCFGHIHASGGQAVVGQTRFINAAVVAGRYPYEVVREPIVVELALASAHR